jgi:hypothetical protein
VDTIARKDIDPIANELRTRKLDPIPTAAPTAENDEVAGADDEGLAAATLGCMLSDGQACGDAERAAQQAEGERHERD